MRNTRLLNFLLEDKDQLKIPFEGEEFGITGADEFLDWIEENPVGEVKGSNLTFNQCVELGKKEIRKRLQDDDIESGFRECENGFYFPEESEDSTGNESQDPEEIKRWKTEATIEGGKMYIERVVYCRHRDKVGVRGEKRKELTYKHGRNAGGCWSWKIGGASDFAEGYTKEEENVILKAWISLEDVDWSTTLRLNDVEAFYPSQREVDPRPGTRVEVFEIMAGTRRIPLKRHRLVPASRTDFFSVSELVPVSREIGFHKKQGRGFLDLKGNYYKQREDFKTPLYVDITGRGPFKEWDPQGNIRVEMLYRKDSPTQNPSDSEVEKACKYPDRALFRIRSVSTGKTLTVGSDVNRELIQSVTPVGSMVCVKRYFKKGYHVSEKGRDIRMDPEGHEFQIALIDINRGVVIAETPICPVLHDTSLWKGSWDCTLLYQKVVKKGQSVVVDLDVDVCDSYSLSRRNCIGKSIQYRLTAQGCEELFRKRVVDTGGCVEIS